ncbi:MFS transporter [Castellaniella defragrans]|uniref:MFS family permease n=1 Tax=Castellaniella defragrans TaxID=75697 RepID=A0A7W9TPM0_CASDE|nr:MFS transporter [Castellaniella defragrans]KAB0612733.1 MFS transporter [Castellaniella defragrans]MBB6083653.1 MFS family permease [Castellaniella defragrans]
MSHGHSAPDANGRRAIPRTVWMLGLVSLFMDLSSELIHSLLPIFLVSGLGASVLAVGVIEGVAEATALIVKVFSGAISDFLGRRKGLLLAGYGLAALSKPLFPLAHSVGMVFAARFIDRIGKGIRGAPRDALVADVTPPDIRGAAFGLRQSMDTVGAVLGPALAVVLMLAFTDIRHVLWFAVVPGVVAMALLFWGVREARPDPAEARAFRSPIRWDAARGFGAAYWRVVAIGAVFTLARFSEAFLILRGQDMGLSAAWAPAVLIVMSLFFTLSAYPAGRLSDRVPRSAILAAGLVLLVLADLALAATSGGAWLLLAGAALWGLHMGFSQGILAAMVADTTPAGLKGTAFGIFNLASGICMLLASVLAGWLWQSWGPSATFLAGAGFAAAALLGLGVPVGRGKRG